MTHEDLRLNDPLAQHETVKRRLEDDVRRDIAREARENGGERAEVQRLGAVLEQRAVQDVAGAERQLQRARVVARVGEVVNYIFVAIYSLIGLEFILELTGARDGNMFKRAIDTVSHGLLVPFRGLFNDPRVGDSRVMFSYLAALVAWGLLHLALRGLLRLVVSRGTPV